MVKESDKKPIEVQQRSYPRKKEKSFSLVIYNPSHPHLSYDMSPWNKENARVKETSLTLFSRC